MGTHVFFYAQDIESVQDTYTKFRKDGCIQVTGI